MPLTVPTWIGAIAVVVLAAGAIVAVCLARAAFKAQSQQLRDQQEINKKIAEMLPLQASELRESLNERLRAQAAQIFIEVDRTSPDAEVTAAAGQEDPAPLPWQLRAKVHNTSKQPIHDLYVIWQLGTVRMGKPDPMARLMPGCDASFDRMGPEAGAQPQPVDPSALGAFLAFRDAAGVRWAVREDGTFTEISWPSPDTRVPGGASPIPSDD
jgi:hypothetical protein